MGTCSEDMGLPMEAERVFNDIKYTKYNWIGEITGNKINIEYWDEVLHCWETLRETLEQYARLPLYDPQYF